MAVRREKLHQEVMYEGGRVVCVYVCRSEYDRGPTA